MEERTAECKGKGFGSLFVAKWCKSELFNIVEIRNVSEEFVSRAEDFLIPLLEENKIEGRLELRCPNCEADLGTFKKYHEIPEEIECEICGHKFPRSEEYLNIVLEVTGTKFFRAQRISSTSSQKKTHQTRNGEIIERGC